MSHCLYIHANAILCVLFWNSHMVIDLYTYSVGLRRCSFRLIGQFSGASDRGASKYAGLHVLFLCLQWGN